MKIKSILMVDDDIDDSEFFTLSVQQINPEIIVSVADSKEALFQQLNSSAPDLLIVDSIIQKDSGHSSIAEIRSDSRFQHLPIIMYTGSSDQTSIQKAFNAGATSYVVKPHTMKEISQVMNYLLNKDWESSSSVKKEYYLNGQFKEFI